MTKDKQRHMILSTYRSLYKLIQNLTPDSKFHPKEQLQILRSTYRNNRNLTEDDEIQKCIQKAGEQIAFLRIITPKKYPTTNSISDNSNHRGVRKWIFTKDGKMEITNPNQDGNPTTTSRKTGRVVSNWDGNNLDPCAVHRHKGQLKRMGFVNNLHAKGLF